MTKKPDTRNGRLKIDMPQEDFWRLESSWREAEARAERAEAELREAREALRDVLDLGAIDVGMWRVEVGINCAPLVRARGVLENGAQQADEG